MNTADNERRAEAAGARRRDIQRHAGHGKRLQAAPQPLELRIGTSAASVN
jgi:hypothetical protein